MNNLIALMGEWDRPDEGWTLTERGLELARARGHRSSQRGSAQGSSCISSEARRVGRRVRRGRGSPRGGRRHYTERHRRRALASQGELGARRRSAVAGPGSNASPRTSSSRRIRSGWHRGDSHSPWMRCSRIGSGRSSTTPSALTGTWRTARGGRRHAQVVADGALLLGDRSAAAHLAAVYEGSGRSPREPSRRAASASWRSRRSLTGMRVLRRTPFARLSRPRGATDAPTRSRPCSRTTARGSSSAVGHPRPAAPRRGTCPVGGHGRDSVARAREARSEIEVSASP